MTTIKREEGKGLQKINIFCPTHLPPYACINLSKASTRLYCIVYHVGVGENYNDCKIKFIEKSHLFQTQLLWLQKRVRCTI